MIYFFHHYELPVILQQAQIRDIINRSNGQVHINFNNVVSMNNNNNNNIAANANNNNNNAAPNNNNVVRRIIRPRFTFGRFQFRFVFQAMHNPPVPPPQAPASPAANATNTTPPSADNSSTEDGATANNTVSTESTRTQGENNRFNLPPLATSNDVLDTAALQRYASEVVESAR
ncbi:MAG: hypothetical protein GY696_09955, partial [Gammaproteobacteria bacterium]|nr:hypothetical protein [Gammaproteobacteria bacterium]